MTYRSIIFDLDGTLIDSARLTGSILDQMLEERGAARKADRDQIRSMDAVGGEAMIGAVMGKYCTTPAADLEEFRARHRVIEIPSTLPFPGVTEALEQLRRNGTLLAICSNKPQFLCEKILGALRLDHHFSAIIGSGFSRPRKPHPAGAMLALAALGSSNAETLFCGDSLVDLATAEAAQLDALLVSWGYGVSDAVAQRPSLPLLRSMASLVELIHPEQS